MTIDVTIDEAIKEEQTLYDIAKDKYEKLGIKNCLKRMEEHKQYIEWFEELKSIREMDLSIPQHFTKEQSDWIKAYCIQRNKEFYNKAIDDFAEKLKAKEEELFEPDYGGMYDSSYERSFNNGILALDESIDEIAE